MLIPINKINVNPEQPRTTFTDEDIRSLADSIRARGQLAPILVEHDKEKNVYIIHDGERRLRAHKLLGRDTIDANVVDLHLVTKMDRILNAFVANAQRKDLLPMEEARAFRRLRDLGMRIIDIVQQTGVNMNTIDSRMALLDLDPEIQQLVDDGKLPMDKRVVKALMSVEDRDIRVKLAKKIAREGITIAAIQSACQRLVEQMAAAAAAKEAADNGVKIKPMIALTNAHSRPATQAAKWTSVRAAAQGVCNSCDRKAELGDVAEPAWTILMAAANETCTECSLLPRGASMAICESCPAVDLLSRILRSSKPA